MAKEDMVVCTNCGGDGQTGMDEQGCYYSCYRCCETGYITKAAADQEAREAAIYECEREQAESARRKAYGVPDGWGYYIDEYEGDVVLVPPRGLTAPKVWGPDAVSELDDIPF
jgi:hypothetical protein